MMTRYPTRARRGQPRRMNEDMIRARTLRSAKLLLDERLTIREVADRMGVSKSTVSVDLKHRLPRYNPQLAHEVCAYIQYNLLARNHRGGAATARLYMERRFNIQRDAVIAAREARGEEVQRGHLPM